MPRFYFDTRQDETFFPDEEGMEFPDLTAAEREAGETAASIARDQMRNGRAQCITVEVRNEDRRRLLAATVSLHIERDEFRLH